MPTYEYLCEKCGLEFEKFQAMAEDALTVCPKDLCKKKRWAKGKVKRIIGSGAGLIFKGSGFYITDYRSDSYKEAAKKDTSSTKSSGGKSGDSSSGSKKGASKSKSTKSASKGGGKS